ncbi:MAG: hypothetical protein AVDCRST_MAG57-1160 [uncultured Blastococcus sp.]|uniref:Uncharacterized protein n=1 Tax=uncultured Blastococcus sp. TaxID=217144 RepID=A0A6J4HVB3_9ACTN|nr:MAG: hypothetical protein AVDCRST_MAG57-1160 [uncultured Blastococcus sp.]
MARPGGTPRVLAPGRGRARGKEFTLRSRGRATVRGYPPTGKVG